MPSVPTHLLMLVMVAATSAHYPYHHHLPVYPRLYRGTYPSYPSYPSYYPALYPAYYPHPHPAVQIQHQQSPDLIGNGEPFIYVKDCMHIDSHTKVSNAMNLVNNKMFF